MTASVYVLYEPGTGRILGSGYGDDVYASEMTPAGMAILFGYTGDASYHYVNEATNQVVQRPELVAHDMDVSVVQADGFDAATITGIPIGWNYEVSNGASGVTDGTDVVLTALEPGTFTIKFTNWPYQDIEYTINASATPL